MRKMRPRLTREQWAALIEQQGQSGLSIEAFCLEQDIGFASFGKWKRRVGGAEAKESGFKAMRVASAPVTATEPEPATITLSIGTSMTLTIVHTNPGA
ncbi:hypothetical protein N9850_04100 [Granulosicoccus sp.]|nr:hypothetical protein [Granulosicoccus sp.]MDB4222931.1 hypothetical protein [Granulosicoccus sp.]